MTNPNNPSSIIKPSPSSSSSSLTKRPNTNVNKKKNKRKKKNNVAIPLVKGLSASSLVRENAIKAASSFSGNKKQRISNNNSSNKNSLFKSIADSQAVISEYHTLNKRLEQNENDTSITDKQRKRNADNIRKQQEEMGGLDRYQKASIFGAKSSKFVCADWVVPFLLEDGTKNPRKQEQDKDPTGQKKLEDEEEAEKEDSICDESKQQQKQRSNIRILDVGAIDNQYKKFDDWLDAVPIDLHGGQHESVLQVDFFDYAHEYCLKNDLAAATSASSTAATSTATNNDEYDNKGKRRRHKLLSSSSSSSLPPPQPFDAIVMSLVLNFQGDPRKRGDMIALAADPRLLRSDTKGMLFVALPSASLDNSRYCDLNRFVDVCKTLGFALVEKKKSLKLILLAFRRRASDSNDDDVDDDDDDDNDNDNNFDTKGRQTHHHYYNTKTRAFGYGKQEMKRLPAKPGAKRNNFSVILKSTINRDK